jgi:hypothetical protein
LHAGGLPHIRVLQDSGCSSCAVRTSTAHSMGTAVC